MNSKQTARFQLSIPEVSDSAKNIKRRGIKRFRDVDLHRITAFAKSVGNTGGRQIGMDKPKEMIRLFACNQQIPGRRSWATTVFSSRTYSCIELAARDSPTPSARRRPRCSSGRHRSPPPRRCDRPRGGFARASRGTSTTTPCAGGLCAQAALLRSRRAVRSAREETGASISSAVGFSPLYRRRQGDSCPRRSHLHLRQVRSFCGQEALGRAIAAPSRRPSVEPGQRMNLKGLGR